MFVRLGGKLTRKDYPSETSGGIGQNKQVSLSFAMPVNTWRLFMTAAGSAEQSNMLQSNMLLVLLIRDERRFRPVRNELAMSTATKRA